MATNNDSVEKSVPEQPQQPQAPQERLFLLRESGLQQLLNVIGEVPTKFGETLKLILQNNLQEVKPDQVTKEG